MEHLEQRVRILETTLLSIAIGQLYAYLYKNASKERYDVGIDMILSYVLCTFAISALDRYQANLRR
jgi:hypothetical protein